MPIQEERFDDEEELHAWVTKNFKQFFGDAMLVPGFRITTRRNKGGVPDAFVFGPSLLRRIDQATGAVHESLDFLVHRSPPGAACRAIR